MGEFIVSTGNVHIDDAAEVARAQQLGYPVEFAYVNAVSAEEALTIAGQLREKNRAGSPLGESGLTPEGPIGKTAGLSYKPEAE